jgi:hypothetical protein
MKYEKPLVVDLSAAARSDGHEPQMCKAGNGPIGDKCYPGASGTQSSGDCVGGMNPGTGEGCGNGYNAWPSECADGIHASWHGSCSAGPSDH